ncbi:uncharacterized protein [Apostichopus japonicus]|uniref:uncharacterized protein n=1 Tax=Stichopus japonicus TaxID=307972 RepID=UPI003AB37480
MASATPLMDLAENFFLCSHKQQANKIKDKLAECTKERKRGLEDIGSKRIENHRQVTLNLEEELSQVRKKYDKLLETTNQKYDNESEEFVNKCDETEGELFRKLGSLDANFKNLTTAKDLRVNQNKDELKQMREYCEQIIKRYENLTATASSILASKDNWTDAQCIPDIRTACDTLMIEMKTGIPELNSLSDFVISDITKVIRDIVTIAQHEESVVDVAGIKVQGRYFTGFTSRGDLKIVIIYKESEGYLHISVFNRKAEIQRQDQIKSDRNVIICGMLSEFKVITASRKRNEIGIYDVRDGAFSRKNIRDVITNWPSKQYVSCVTTDPVKNHIIVGTDSRDVYVFTDQLIYSHMFTLPDVIDTPHDISVHRGSLLVCDNSRGRSYAVTMEESQSKLMYEFTKPDLDGLHCRPISVCTDNNEFIYMLWKYDNPHHSMVLSHLAVVLMMHALMAGCNLVQYSQDGRKLLTKRKFDHNADCVSTIEENGMEKLLVSTTVASFHTFDLEVT